MIITSDQMRVILRILAFCWVAVFVCIHPAKAAGIAMKMTLKVLLVSWAIWLIFILPFGIVVPYAPSISYADLQLIFLNHPESINCLSLRLSNQFGQAFDVVSVGQNRDLRIVRWSENERWKFARRCDDRSITVRWSDEDRRNLVGTSRDQGIPFQSQDPKIAYHWTEVSATVFRVLLHGTAIWLLASFLIKVRNRRMVSVP
jgi:hypothetical protein